MDTPEYSNPFDEDEKTGRRQVIWSVLGLGTACISCLLILIAYFYRPDPQALFNQYFPSPTVTPSQTPSSTPTLTPTTTQTPSPTPNMTATVQVQNAQSTAESAASNWQVILTDTFDSNKNNWLVGESEDEYALTNYQVVDGKYRWEATAHKSFISWVEADEKPLTDFYLSMDVQQMEGSETTDYGVVFREDDDSNFYYFGISDNGNYSFHLYFGDWDTLIDWTETDLIQAGESNRITVIGEGAHFTFFINGEYLTETTDDTLPEGSTSLAMEMSNEDDHSILEFDNFELRAP
jgi:hypothetical protein